MLKISNKILPICFTGFALALLGCLEGIPGEEIKLPAQKLSSSILNNSYYLISRKGNVTRKWREGLESRSRLNEFNSAYSAKDKVVQIEIKNALEANTPKKLFIITKQQIDLPFIPPNGNYVLEPVKNGKNFILHPCKVVDSKKGSSLPTIEKIEPSTDWNPLENKFSFSFDDTAKILIVNFEEKEEKDVIDYTGRYFGWATYIFQALKE